MKHDEREKLIEELSEVVNQLWAEEETEIASFYAGEFGDEDAAWDLIKSFVDFCEDLKINPDGTSQEAFACFHAMGKMLRRVLAVDMSKPANRKGDLPRAMGLVSRRDAHNRIRDHVVYYAFEHAKYNMGVAGRGSEDCFDLLTSALEKSGRLPDAEDEALSVENIKKIFHRAEQELMG